MRVIFISDSRLCGVERMSLGSSCSVVDKINYYCVPGLQLDRVKQYINSERFEKLCRHHRVVVFLSVGVNDILENIYDRTERELTKVYERVIRKYQQVDQGIKSINRHIKLIIATIPPKDLIQTLLKYPHKSEKIETITRDHQTSYENFVCRINEEFINMFNNNETEVHIPLHRALRVRRGGRYQYYKLHDGLHPGDELKKDWMEMILTRLEQYLLK